MSNRAFFKKKIRSILLTLQWSWITEIFLIHLAKPQPEAVSDTNQPAEEIQEATAKLAAANQISLIIAAEALKVAT